MWKKISVSLAVLIAFVGYVLHTKFGEHEEGGPVTANPTPTTDTTTSPSTANRNTDTAGTTTNSSSGSSGNGMMNGNSMMGQYKNGTYTGNVADAFYGNIQVQVTISKGQISDIQFLQYPNDRGNSIYINQQAMPLLKQEAIQVQSANVGGVSGATASSQAFVQSLRSALSQAN